MTMQSMYVYTEIGQNCCLGWYGLHRGKSYMYIESHKLK